MQLSQALSSAELGLGFTLPELSAQPQLQAAVAVCAVSRCRDRMQPHSKAEVQVRLPAGGLHRRLCAAERDEAPE